MCPEKTGVLVLIEIKHYILCIIRATKLVKQIEPEGNP